MKKDMWGLQEVELLPTLLQFFAHLSLSQITALLDNYILRLGRIKDVVSRSNGHFYSSSILLVYDHSFSNHWDGRMIDFVHSQILPNTDPTVDENYLEGVQSLIGYLQRLRGQLHYTT